MEWINEPLVWLTSSLAGTRTRYIWECMLSHEAHGQSFIFTFCSSVNTICVPPKGFQRSINSSYRSLVWIKVLSTFQYTFQSVGSSISTMWDLRIIPPAIRDIVMFRYLYFFTAYLYGDTESTCICRSVPLKSVRKRWTSKVRAGTVGEECRSFDMMSEGCVWHTAELW